MKNKTVIKTSLFPASKSIVFGEIKKLSTLQYIAFPYAAFMPVNGQNDLIWQSGEIFDFRFRLFGIIPLGIHRIAVVDFDEESGIYTKEGNKHVPVWNHRIIIEPTDRNTVRYTDEVEIIVYSKLENVEALSARMIDITSATANITLGEEFYLSEQNGQIIL